MEHFLWHPEHDEMIQRLFNCSFYSVTDIWFPDALFPYEDPVVGTAFTSLATIEFLIYIPYVVALFGLLKDELQQTVFKQLFALAIVDMVGVANIGFLGGYLVITGSTYCKHPYLEYLNGVFVFALLVASSWLKATLSLDRCFERVFPLFAPKVLNYGWAPWIWPVPALLLGLWTLLFATPLTYSSIRMSYTMNPHYGYIEHLDYQDFFGWYWWPNKLLAFGYFIVYIIAGTVIGVRWSNTFEEEDDDAPPTGPPQGAPRQIQHDPFDYMTPEEIEIELEKRALFMQMLLMALIDWIFILYSMTFYLQERWQSTTSAVVFLFYNLQCHGLAPMYMMLFNTKIRDGACKFMQKVLCRTKKK